MNTTGSVPDRSSTCRPSGFRGFRSRQRASRGRIGLPQPSGGAASAKGLILLLLGALAVGCGSGSDDQETSFLAELVAMDSIKLTESDDTFVGSVGAEGGVAFGPEGRLAVVDRLGSRVIVFGRDGSLEATVGREGDGPGEFRVLQAVGWDSQDRLWASDNQRITVFDRELALDTIFQGVPEIDYVRRLKPAGGAMVMEEYRWPVQGTVVRSYGARGEPGPSIFKVPPRDGEPYVLGEFRASIHVAGDTVLAASSVSYPLYMYDLEGNLITTFGTRPPSIGTVTYPGRGAYAGSRQNLAFDWLRSFGTVQSIWVVHDSLVVVEHARRHPEPGGIPPRHYWIDVYDRWTLTKLAEDLPLPGHVLDVHDDLIWILTGTPLTSEPVGGPWTLTGFTIETEP